MMNRILPVMALAAGLGLAACSGADEADTSTTETEIITEPGTETVEIEVPTTDSLMVERTVETDVDVDVDTTEIN